MHSRLKFSVLTFIYFFSCWLGLSMAKAQEYQQGSLSPLTWTKSMWEAAGTKGNGKEGPVIGTRHMIINAGMPEASFAGFQVLEQGGSAMDAALTAALADITLKFGASVSFAGFMNILYYDASTGLVHSMNAGWNTPLEEKDPLSIPEEGPGDDPGRTVLVPGFMKGVEAAHQRFGRIPFSALFEPAIYFAEHGVPVSPLWAYLIDWQKEYLGRIPDTRAIFSRMDGEWVAAGDTVYQKALAGTLRKLGQNGADYMYSGEWAQRLVLTIQNAGGYLSMKDLENYQVIWAPPVQAKYRDYDVFGMAPPTMGGVNTIEALQVLEQEDLAASGHYSGSPETLFLLLRAARLSDLFGTSFNANPMAEHLRLKYIPQIGITPDDRTSKTHARTLHNAILDSSWNEMIREADLLHKANGNGHSDAIVVVDSDGNMAAVLHTCNTMLWGQTGIFVDGISIPDAASGNREQMARVGPGQRLEEATCPTMVLKDGKPFLVCSSLAMGVHEVTLQNLVNVLDFQMDPFEANQMPHFTAPLLAVPEKENVSSDPNERKRVLGPQTQIIEEGRIDEAVLQAARDRGEFIEAVPRAWFESMKGMWIGILLNNDTGHLSGSTVNPRTGGAHAR